VYRPAELVGEHSATGRRSACFPGVGRRTCDVGQLTNDRRKVLTVRRDDRSDLVIEIRITADSGLRRSAVEPTVGDAVEPQLLHDMHRTARSIYAQRAVLGRQHLTES
jgi:hypothetical protein